jgi:hypothetical protein
MNFQPKHNLYSLAKALTALFRIESFPLQAVTQEWEKIFHLTFCASVMTFNTLIFFLLPIIFLIIFNLSKGPFEGTVLL